MIIQNSTDIKTEYFLDKNGDPSPIDVQYEKHNINPNGLVQLRNIPSIHTVFNITTKNGINVIKYNKVDKIVNQTDFTVDYPNGLLTFHSSQISKEIQVSYTNAIGRLSISSDRIFTKIDNQGNIVQTLNTLIEEGMEVLSNLETIGGANKIINELKGYVESVKGLSTTIIEGSNTNNNLKKTDETAKTTNSTLNSTITNADGKIQEMTEWVNKNGDVVNLNNRVGIAEGKLNTVSASLEQKASQQALNVEKGRIDNIVALPQTVDNVETADIRVGADGVTYQSAGDSVRSQINKIKNEVNNLINFQSKTYLNDIITVTGEAGTSVLNIKANGTTTANKTFQIFMDTNLTDKNFLLKPNTTYTISAKRKGGTYIDTRAVSLILKRRDTLANVATINLGQVILGNQQTVTFTTPNLNKYYFDFVFATGSFNFNVDIVVNLIEGSTVSYEEYSIDINNGFKIKKDVELLKKKLGGVYNIIVAKDGSGDYTTLTEAVDKAKDFDVIYVKNGIYENEIVKAWLKTVFIIGQSRSGVIIRNNTGAYATPPIEIGTGLLKDLTIHFKNDGATPSNKGYSIHSESSVDNYDTFEIDNCNIISEWRQSWGMGMRGETKYIARNTLFDGGVYFHDCQHSYRATKQEIFFDNCIITRNDTSAGLIFQDQQMPTAQVDVRFNRCLVKSKLGTNVIFYKWDSANNTVINATGFVDFPTWKLNDFSWGNSINQLNI